MECPGAYTFTASTRELFFFVKKYDKTSSRLEIEDLVLVVHFCSKTEKSCSVTHSRANMKWKPITMGIQSLSKVTREWFAVFGTVSEAHVTVGTKITSKIEHLEIRKTRIWLSQAGYWWLPRTTGVLWHRTEVRGARYQNAWTLNDLNIDIKNVPWFHFAGVVHFWYWDLAMWAVRVGSVLSATVQESNELGSTRIREVGLVNGVPILLIFEKKMLGFLVNFG